MDWLDVDAWNGYVAMRKQMGKSAPFTQRAEELSLRKLEDFHRQGYDTGFILDTATERGWRGLFLTNDTPRRTLSTGEQSNVRKINEMIGRIGK